MNWYLVLLAGAIGYLAGSLSFARIMVRLVAPGQQITGMDVGPAGQEMHVSAVSGTAVSIKLGPKYGMLTALLDILKVALPTLAFKLLYPGQPYFLVTAALGIVGHDWPLYYRFQGGRGLSAIYGGFLVVDFIGTLVTAIAGMFVGLALKKIVLSYLLGLWLLIPWVWFRTHDPARLAYLVWANVLFVLAMIPEIREIQKRQREGTAQEFTDAMEATPMGKMIKRMGQKLHLIPE